MRVGTTVNIQNLETLTVHPTGELVLVAEPTVFLECIVVRERCRATPLQALDFPGHGGEETSAANRDQWSLCPSRWGYVIPHNFIA
jgi:hypothetical protein